MSYQVLARRWRPQDFDTVIGQEATITTLRHSLQNQKIHQAYLFTGTRGVGKTSLARIVARCLNCETGVTDKPCGTCKTCQSIEQGQFIDLIEIDAASHTKVEDIRGILDNIPYRPTQGRYKVYLIDEVHMLSNHSFNALLKTLEEPPEYVKFLLATTDPQKLPATILSRCLRFHLHNLSVEQLQEHLENILKHDKIDYEKSAVTQIAKAARGSVRDSLSILDQAIAHGNGKINAQEVQHLLGHIAEEPLQQLLTAIQTQNTSEALQNIATLDQQGADFSRILDQLIEAFHQLAVEQSLNKKQQAGDWREQVTPESTQLCYQIALHGTRDLPLAPSARIGFEMTILRIMAFCPVDLSSSATPNINSSPKITATHAKSENTITASDQVKSQVKSQASIKRQETTATTTTSINEIKWDSELCEQLELSGITLEIAKHCTLAEKNGNQWTLKIEQKHRALLQNKHRERIQTALQTYTKQPITIDIIANDSNDAIQTPAAASKQQKEIQKSAAEKNIKNDQNVKKLIEAFDAEIVAGSIIRQEASCKTKIVEK